MAHLTIARVTKEMIVPWNTTDNAVLAEGERVQIEPESRFEGITTVGINEHVRRHANESDKYVTVAIDLTRSRTPPAPPGCRK